MNEEGRREWPRKRHFLDLFRQDFCSKLMAGGREIFIEFFGQILYHSFVSILIKINYLGGGVFRKISYMGGGYLGKFNYLRGGGVKNCAVLGGG